jgi:hypothetical protein
MQRLSQPLHPQQQPPSSFDGSSTTGTQHQQQQQQRGQHPTQLQPSAFGPQLGQLLQSQQQQGVPELEGRLVGLMLEREAMEKALLREQGEVRLLVQELEVQQGVVDALQVTAGNVRQVDGGWKSYRLA